MKKDFWQSVEGHLYEIAEAPDKGEWKLNNGQRASLCAIAKRLPANGVLIADEVGMGKTRIAVAVAKSVIESGGRVAILAPSGLGYQWRDELRKGKIECPLILRSVLQYLQAWEAEDEREQKPWFKERVVLISHAFTNWRLGEGSNSWRWTLLPELYAQWRRNNSGRFPQGYNGNENLNDEWVKRAARSICNTIQKGHPYYKSLPGPAENSPKWIDTLDGANYEKNGIMRPWFQKSVGLGLGVFDLVVIDEAHKGRGQDSGLSNLLDHVLLVGKSHRRLAMTATPVELDASQWQQTLERILAPDQLNLAIERYMEAVKEIREIPSDGQVCAKFKQAAQTFQESLAPYLLRRDKREDPYVHKFTQITKRGFYEYREESKIIVETSQLAMDWKKAICAAESLSLVIRQAEDPVAKRLRLTLGNGHGIAALLDQVKLDDKTDNQQEEYEGIGLPVNGGSLTDTDDKNHQRVQWWRDIMCHAFKTEDSSDSALYEHPALLAAITAIESTCSLGEKVLVFGRFTRPLKALVQLFNAREMLRCLDTGHYWPQSRVPEDEWETVRAAHRQLKCPGEVDQRQVNKKLSTQYQKLDKQREQYRNGLIRKLCEGIEGLTKECYASQLFDVLKDRVENGKQPGHDSSLLTLLAKAMQELTGLDTVNLQPADYANAFSDLVDALSDRDDSDFDEDGVIEKGRAVCLLETMEQRLKEEYDSPQGGFARLMYGGTKAETRRLLQAAFNRPNCYPKVLVAQSMVGREGLNLHKACRSVVLLHPEWNPGVVEQQIGRIDRIGGLWENLLDQWLENSKNSGSWNMRPPDPPRIQVRPVIFKGTYDEKNWEVLQNRWADLRAQLHGIILEPSIVVRYEGAELIRKINESAPCFSPKAV
ncbi:MAG: DEAD/DEAH box helicase [Syntrophobacteraceae bacterium]